MRLFTLTLILLLLFVSTARFTSAADPATILRSIRPLTTVAVDTESGAAALVNICTVSSINEEKHLWLTAAHCVLGDHITQIQGEQTAVVMIDERLDIAILTTPLASAPALKLATEAPRVLDTIIVAGHPLGFVYPLVTIGTVASAFAVLDLNMPPFLLIQAAGAPGNSGSPILNSTGEIISVLQIGFARGTFSPMMGGAVFEALAQFRAFWG